VQASTGAGLGSSWLWLLLRSLLCESDHRDLPLATCSSSEGTVARTTIDKYIAGLRTGDMCKAGPVELERASAAGRRPWKGEAPE
jgi:hypothetical protein